ncbi:hypothetical protein [Lacrimispora amygdalina]|uniref:hypothetical protein n=1 Tax=Lacrimispora amygdalina TaxID=253257 RepID=UPI0031F99E4C
MELKKDSIKKHSIFHLLNANHNSKEKLEARLLDYMQKHPELTPAAPAPPPDEFQKIMTEFHKRGSKTIVRKQLRILHYWNSVICCLQRSVLTIRRRILKLFHSMKRKQPE